MDGVDDFARRVAVFVELFRHRSVVELDRNRVAEHVEVDLAGAVERVVERVERDCVGSHVVSRKDAVVERELVASVRGQLTGDRARRAVFVGEAVRGDDQFIPTDHFDLGDRAVRVDDLDRVGKRLGAVQQHVDRVDLEICTVRIAVDVVALDLLAFELEVDVCILQEPALDRFPLRVGRAVGREADLEPLLIVVAVVLDIQLLDVEVGEPDRQLAAVAVAELDKRRRREVRFLLLLRLERVVDIRVDDQFVAVSRRRIRICEPHLGDCVEDDVDRNLYQRPSEQSAVLALVERDRRFGLHRGGVADFVERQVEVGDGDVNCLVIAVRALVVVRFRLRRQDVVGAVAARQDIQIDVVRVDLNRVAEVAVLDRGDLLRPDVDLDVDALHRLRTLSDDSRNRTGDCTHVCRLFNPFVQQCVELFGVHPLVDLHADRRAVRIVEVQHLGRERRDVRRRLRHRVQVDNH